MKFQVIEFEKENLNGRKYVKHEISNLPEFVLCSMRQEETPEIAINGEFTLGMAKMTMDEKGIYAELEPYSHKKEIFDEMLIDGNKIVSAGYGNVNEKGEVANYRLQYIFLTKEPA